MISGSHQGEWFLPSGKKYSGQLLIDNKKSIIELEIFGKEYIDEQKINFKSDNPQPFHSLILGYCGGATTLYNCYLSGCSEIGKDLFRITYTVEFVFTGIHFQNTDELSIKWGTFVFPNLSSWYDGSGVFHKLEGKQDLYINGEHIIQNTRTREKVPINDELDIFIWDDVQKKLLNPSIRYEVEFIKFLTFQYKKNVAFTRLLNDANIFRKLLEFSYGKPLGCHIININSAEPGPMHVNNYTLLRNKPLENHTSYSAHMLLSNWDFPKEELNQYIIQWFKNEQLYNIYEYYNDSNNWLQGTDGMLSNVMFNNRFLNLIQGLEDYYREHFEKTKSKDERMSFSDKKNRIMSALQQEPELKKWLNDTFNFEPHFSLTEKLTTIITDLNPDINQLFHNISLSDFPTLAAYYRNELSHGKNKEVNMGNDFHKNFLIAQVLLGVCILKTLGVKNIAQKIIRYQKFEDKIYEIIAYSK